MTKVFVTGAFDNLRSPDVRFLQEAGMLGSVCVVLEPDAAIAARTGRPPKFPEPERRYLLQSLRYVDSVAENAGLEDKAVLFDLARPGDRLVTREEDRDSSLQRPAADLGLEQLAIPNERLAGFPDPDRLPPITRPRVLVTGCYDWFHSGHVRFFEEVSELGDLFVVVGHDANIALLKGQGHPLFSEQERRYLVQSVRFVARAMISSGHGWLDAEPEIEQIRPDIYAVNDDGDRPEKRDYCAAHGIEFRVLRRTPKPGLPRRQSTDLRGF